MSLDFDFSLLWYIWDKNVLALQSLTRRTVCLFVPLGLDRILSALLLRLHALRLRNWLLEKVCSVVVAFGTARLRLFLGGISLCFGLLYRYPKEICLGSAALLSLLCFPPPRGVWLAHWGGKEELYDKYIRRRRV